MKQTLTIGEKKTAPDVGPFKHPSEPSGQVAGDLVELVAEIAPGELDRADDDNADQGRDKVAPESSFSSSCVCSLFRPSRVRHKDGSAAGNAPEPRSDTLQSR
jgi:hypothetical protein